MEGTAQDCNELLCRTYEQDCLVRESLACQGHAAILDFKALSRDNRPGLPHLVAECTLSCWIWKVI